MFNINRDISCAYKFRLDSIHKILMECMSVEYVNLKFWI